MNNIYFILGYFYVWGVIYIIVTTLVALLKHENSVLIETNTVINFAIIKTYKLLLSIMRLPNIKKFAIILLTVKVGNTVYFLLNMNT